MTNIDQVHEILGELVASFTDRPRDIVIRSERINGVVYWTLRGHGDDHGKLVGKQGSHAKALAVLMIALGNAQGDVFAFELQDPTQETRLTSARKLYAKTYNAEPARELLARIIENLVQGEFSVESEQMPSGIPLLFEFNILTKNPDDLNLLVHPSASLPSPLRGISIGDAITTLYRARANKEGVHFNISVIA